MAKLNWFSANSANVLSARPYPVQRSTPPQSPVLQLPWPAASEPRARPDVCRRRAGRHANAPRVAAVQLPTAAHQHRGRLHCEGSTIFSLYSSSSTPSCLGARRWRRPSAAWCGGDWVSGPRESGTDGRRATTEEGEAERETTSPTKHHGAAGGHRAAAEARRMEQERDRGRAAEPDCGGA
ncbi:hypothetical protein GQ55_1G269000 [Panicum hallii var. hallii]|uniref:Uncharacterized protein n=1 Tax=Panicum hallii var. hallii TaxID=1504633 RepID=A0A2T7F7W4_9POAL|nr:hypothetical protein GQ55_1G269000 [Panicum hallii var. hallii]